MKRGFLRGNYYTPLPNLRHEKYIVGGMIFCADVECDLL
jgi:hypothetical protein